MLTAAEDQHRILANLIQSAQKTVFGTDHSFKDIHTHAEFAQAVPFLNLGQAVEKTSYYYQIQVDNDKTE